MNFSLDDLLRISNGGGGGAPNAMSTTDPNSQAYVNPGGAQGQNINGIIVTPNGGDHALLQSLIRNGAIQQQQPGSPNQDGSTGPRAAIENGILSHQTDATGGHSDVWGRLGAGLNHAIFH